MQTRLKAFKKAGKRKPKCNLEKIKSKENDVKLVIEQNFSQIDGLRDAHIVGER